MDAKWYATWIRQLPAESAEMKLRNLEAADYLEKLDAENAVLKNSGARMNYDLISRSDAIRAIEMRKPNLLGDGRISVDSVIQFLLNRPSVNAEVVCRGYNATAQIESRQWAVADVDKTNRRYLSRFVNQQPYFANKLEAALVFDDRDSAAKYADRCSEYSGRRYGVVNIQYE